MRKFLLSFLIFYFIITTNLCAQSHASTPDPAQNAADPQPSISLIIDHSGSMRSTFPHVKTSAIVLVDLIRIWQKLYPDRLRNLQFQYVKFGGRNEVAQVYALSKISDFENLKRDIRNGKCKYSNTDYGAGIDKALTELQGQKLQNKTIILSDGDDCGKGPDDSSFRYDALGETQFIIYGSGASGKLVSKNEGWMHAIKNSSRENVSSEFEVTGIFVASLFDFVDDINKYLVRRGKQKIKPDKRFMLIKHSGTENHNIVITRPKSDISISKIISPYGNELTQQDYDLHETNTFYQIILNASLPRGEYQIEFSGMKRSEIFNYINFEKCDIDLRLFTTPDLKSGGCFFEDSRVNFEFNFWDIKQDIEIAYSDFIKYTAYSYEITDDQNRIFTEAKDTDSEKLIFSKTFPAGTKGYYNVRSSWNYNLSKMENQKSTQKLITTFCVKPEGSLVHIEYDTSLAWEGRDMEFIGTLGNPGANMLKKLKIINLNTEHGTVKLKQVSANQNEYRGLLSNVKPANYQLSLAHSGRYDLAIDMSSETQFTGNKRLIIVRMEKEEFAAVFDMDITWRDKLMYAISDLFGRQYRHRQTFEYSAQKSIEIPYPIPFSEAYDSAIPIDFSLNKVFDDEELNMRFEIFGDTVFECLEAGRGGIWGAFQKIESIEDAVKVDFEIEKNVDFKADSVVQHMHVVKKKGDMYFDKPLYREPGIKTQGFLKIRLSNGTERRVRLDAVQVTLEVKTDTMDYWLTTAVRWGKWTLLCIAAMVYLIALLLMIAKSFFNCKFKHAYWLQIHNDLLADYWSQESENKKCRPEFEIPDDIKKKFEKKEEFVGWLKTNDKKSLRNRLCRNSMFSSANALGKLVYLAVLPISFFIDKTISALELGSSVISKKELFNYVTKINDPTLPNIPSYWSFKGENAIEITHSKIGSDSLRIRHYAYPLPLARLSFTGNAMQVLALKSTIQVEYAVGKIKTVTIGQAESSPPNVRNIIIKIEKNFTIVVSNINFEERACDINIK